MARDRGSAALLDYKASVRTRFRSLLRYISTAFHYSLHIDSIPLHLTLSYSKLPTLRNSSLHSPPHFTSLHYASPQLYLHPRICSSLHRPSLRPSLNSATTSARIDPQRIRNGPAMSRRVKTGAAEPLVTARQSRYSGCGRSETPRGHRASIVPLLPYAENTVSNKRRLVAYGPTSTGTTAAAQWAAAAPGQAGGPPPQGPSDTLPPGRAGVTASAAASARTRSGTSNAGVPSHAATLGGGSPSRPERRRPPSIPSDRSPSSSPNRVLRSNAGPASGSGTRDSNSQLQTSSPLSGPAVTTSTRGRPTSVKAATGTRRLPGAPAVSASPERSGERPASNRSRRPSRVSAGDPTLIPGAAPAPRGRSPNSSAASSRAASVAGRSIDAVQASAAVSTAVDKGKGPAAKTRSPSGSPSTLPSTRRAHSATIHPVPVNVEILVEDGAEVTYDNPRDHYISIKNKQRKMPENLKGKGAYDYTLRCERLHLHPLDILFQG